MNRNLQYRSNDSIKVCKKDFCIEAKGKYADAIAITLMFAFVCIGIAAIAKAA